MNHSEQKIAHRVQIGLVAPLAVVLLAGVIFVRLEDGIKVAVHFVAVQVPVLVVAALLGRAISRRFLVRLNHLRHGAERLEAGQFDYLPVEADEDDEFNDLARAFNHMVRVVASRESGQREQNLALAELNRRMETVLNATNDGIALLDKAGHFTLVNRRFCEMLGTRAEALLYRPVSEAQPLLTSRLARPERLMNRLSPITEEDMHDPVGVAEEVIEIVHAGERRFIQVYTAPVRDEHRHVSGRILALHDITRETEVDKMKTEFISVVSHELRTPLTSIKGYTDLMLTEQAGEINELQREFLGILQGSANRLNNLINDILDISRLESGKVDVKMERVDYEKIVSDVLRLMKAAADEKEQSFDASFPAQWPSVRGDADKITQILTNLLSNAIKYTPAHGWVKVSLEINGASVTTCIADSGIGISPEDQKKLFQKFFRADNSSTREAGGTGLGLAIVKTMVELMGGAIWVESEPGNGSRFYFTLPLYTEVAALEEIRRSAGGAAPAEETIDHDEIEAALAAAGIEPAPRSSDEPPDRIAGTLIDRGLGLALLVDDDVYVREHLQHALHRRGYGVITAYDFDDVIQRARVHKPDVILLDMMMPNRAGFAVRRALQSDPATASLPIVAYSLVGDPVQGALSLGAFSFLRKPVPAQLLVKSLREHLGKRRDLSALFVRLSEAQDGGAAAELSETREALLRARVTMHVVSSPEAAVALAIGERPDVILLDSGEIGAEEGVSGAVFELLQALKSEEDMSRIPLILLSPDAAEAALHFHLGLERDSSSELTVAMGYLGEQIARVMRDRAINRDLGPALGEPSGTPVDERKTEEERYQSHVGASKGA